MNKEQREAYRHAFDAWVDGELQSRHGGEWHDWPPSECPSFTKPPDHYRRKPKPRVVFGWLYDDRMAPSKIGGVFATKEDALAVMDKRDKGFILVRCEEVLE